MSAYITLLTPMVDTECLLEALADVSFGRDVVEVHAQPVPLVGFEGQKRAQQAEIVIRKQHVGASSNDLGFLHTPTGYQLVVSDYDQRRYGPQWLQQLNGCYQEHVRNKQERLAEAERQRMEEQRRQAVEAQRQAIHEKAKKLGYRVQETREGEKLRLVLVKRVY
ncbi:DUF1257 domain-containing protein [Archangium violaceum]|uniref:DUF1257 domain-containing protein n=1 Tax=Archangium violaceum TaxID=83451 RepID=UPI002B28B13E|nr:DUF1257 domain-containing protein [Archangium gephyra]